MAYGEVLFFEHTDLHGVDWRVSLYKKDYVAFAVETNAEDGVFELTYQGVRNIFEPFLASELTANFVIPAAFDDLIDDLAIQPTGVYQLILFKNGQVCWTGYVDNALLSWEDDIYPLPISLRAICGIGMWEKIAYDREQPAGGGSGDNSNQAPITLVDSLNKIAQTFRHNISWEEKDLSGGDIVRYLQVNDYTWSTKSDNADFRDDQPISQRVVAEQYAKRFLARWHQWRGWNLEQPEGTLNGTSFRRNIKNGSSSDLELPPSPVAVSANDWVKGNRFEFASALSSSSVLFMHNAAYELIRFPELYTGAGYFDIVPYSYTEGNHIRWSAQVEGIKLNVEPDERYFLDVILKTSKVDGTVARWWNHGEKKWVNSEYKNVIALTGTTLASFSFETTNIVSGTEQIRVQLSPIYQKTSSTSTTIIESISQNSLSAEFRILGAIEENSESRTTQAITDNGSAEVYDHGTLYVGDDVPTSPYIFRVNDTNQRTTGFNSPGYTTNEPIDRLTTRTINRFYKKPKKVIRGILYKNYEPNQLLRYESVDYLFCGGTLNADGVWQGIWQELNYDNEAVTFDSYLGGALQTLPAGNGSLLGDILSLNFARSAGIEAGQLTSITTNINNGATVSSLSINEVTNTQSIQALKAGYKVNLLNVTNGISQVFTLTSDYAEGDTTLAVNTTTAITSFPKGSALILTGESLTSYVVKTAQFYTAGVQAADVQSIATLSGSLSGTVTALPISALSYQVTDGQKLRVAQAADPNVFDEVEVATDTLVGATSIPILSTTLANSYSSGDAVVFTVAQSSGLLYILAGEASISATNASNSAATAGTARDAAVTAKNLAETARDNAEAFADDAEVFKNSASASASASATSAQAALNAQTQSQSFASSASASATSASGFASAALTARNEAQTAAGQAQTALSQVSASVDGLDTQIVLKGITNADGTTSIAQVQLNTSPGSSNILLSADDIQVAGQTTFLSAISSAISTGAITSPSAKITRSNSAPSSPAVNDMWVDTDDGDKPYSWNGSAWVAMYTSINGGNIETGTVTANQIATNAITAQKIAAGAITTEKIDALAVTAAEIAADAITADKISANAIQSTKINAGAITAEKIATGAITADKIAVGTITADKIAAGTVIAADVQAGSITTEKLATGAITTEKLAAGAITAEKIAAGTVIAADVQAGSITSEELATGAVTAQKIAANAITADKISANAVTSDKINVTTLSAVTANTGNLTVSGWLRSANYNGSVGFALNQDGSADFQQVTVKGVIIAGANSEIDWQYVDNVNIITAQIADANITTAKIADANITTAKIADANITTAKIADANITTAKIADANITTAKIADANITTAKIADATITDAKIADATITNAKIANLDAVKITTGTLSADRIASGSITADKITATNLQAITTSTGALTVDDTLSIGFGGAIEMSSGNTITDDGINLTEGTSNNPATSSSIDWGNNISLFGTKYNAVTSLVVDAPKLTVLGLGEFTSALTVGGNITTSTGTVTASILKGAFQSSDGTAGITETISGFTDLIVKNGLIVGYI